MNIKMTLRTRSEYVLKYEEPPIKSMAREIIVLGLYPRRLLNP